MGNNDERKVNEDSSAMSLWFGFSNGSVNSARIGGKLQKVDLENVGNSDLVFTVKGL